MGNKTFLNNFANELPTLDEFNEKYCKECGTQQCYGVYDELWREGCKIWRELQQTKQNNTMKNAIELIADERKRQIEKEGWTPEHDAEHIEGELANAAATYAMAPDVRDTLTALIPECEIENVPPTWPWDKHWWKPSPDDRIKELVKAGALIVAEIERLLQTKESNS